jgi:transposase
MQDTARVWVTWGGPGYDSRNWVQTLRTSAEQLTVRCYKRLAQVERAFRSLKSVALKVRPIYIIACPTESGHMCCCACSLPMWNGI